MTQLHPLMAILTLAVLATPAFARTQPTCPADGPDSPAELHRQWILDGWEYREGDPMFDFRDKLGRFYDWSSDDVLLFDDFDPDRRAARSAAAYSDVWQPIFRGNRSALHAVSDEPSVAAGPTLSASSLEFTARIERLEGEVTGLQTRSDLVWRCSSDGWKIIREHNSSKIIPVEDAERVLAAHGRLHKTR